MNSSINVTNKEIAAINDLLGTYGSEKRVKEVAGSRHGITVTGSFDPEHNYVLTAEIPESMVLGLAKIAMDHSKAIKGIVKTINGLIETINYVARNVSRDIKNLMREYEEKE